MRLLCNQGSLVNLCLLASRLDLSDVWNDACSPEIWRMCVYSGDTTECMFLTRTHTHTQDRKYTTDRQTHTPTLLQCSSCNAYLLSAAHKRAACLQPFLWQSGAFHTDFYRVKKKSQLCSRAFSLQFQVLYPNTVKTVQGDFELSGETLASRDLRTGVVFVPPVLHQQQIFDLTWQGK